VGGDDIAAGMWLIALRDPYLPVYVRGAEGKMVANLPANHPGPKVLDVSDLAHQQIVWRGRQQVGSRKRATIVFAQRVDQIIHRAVDGHLRIKIRMLANNAESLAIEYHLNIGKAAGARCTHLVGARHLHRAG